MAAKLPLVNPDDPTTESSDDEGSSLAFDFSLPEVDDLPNTKDDKKKEKKKKKKTVGDPSRPGRRPWGVGRMTLTFFFVVEKAQG